MDNMLLVVLLTVVGTAAVLGIGFVFYTAYKGGKGKTFEQLFPEAWTKVRPILSDLFINIFAVYEADKDGFEGLMKFAVGYIQKKIDEAGFLTAEERALLTDKFIDSMIRPTLLELYNQKFHK